MPYETALPAASSMPMTTEQTVQLPVGPPPTPAPQFTPSRFSPLQLTPNSLELHIPIPIPTPPTPLPIVIAYPLSQTLMPQEAQDTTHSRRDTMQTDDSGIELEFVPAPVQAQKSRAEHGAESDELQRDTTAADNEYELIDITEQERLDAQTVYLFRALNVPVNLHRLRAMREKGKLPAPFLKFKYGSSRAKHARALSAPGKENKDVHLTSILKIPSSPSGYDGAPGPEEPTEMETVEGESWYLPSATARRMISRRFEREQPTREESNWESPRPLEMRYELPAPQPVIPSQTLLDQFPLPPTSLPSVTPHPEAYAIPLPPTPAPTPSTSSSGRPLGYMYAPAKPLHRSPSCKSCIGGSPANSVTSSRTLTPAPLPVQAPGCYYAYDFVTPSPGALPYSGYGSVRTVSPQHSISVSGASLPPHYMS